MIHSKLVCQCYVTLTDGTRGQSGQARQHQNMLEIGDGLWALSALYYWRHVNTLVKKKN